MTPSTARRRTCSLEYFRTSASVAPVISHTGCVLHHHAVLSVELGAGGGHGHVLQLDYKYRYSRISAIYTNYLLPGLSKSAYRSGPAKVSTLPMIPVKEKF